MPEPDEPIQESGPAERRSSRWRDTWQLHLPLLLVLALCTVATVIEVRRAGEGVWRAWAYMIEWPLIGAFSVWIWNRYRRHGTLTRGLADRWRAAQRSAAPPPSAAAGSSVPPPDRPADSPEDEDIELTAWERYKADLWRRQGEGPSREA